MAESGGAAAIPARLVGIRGAAMGLQASLNAPETTLGRDAGNSIVLNSSSVSRHHARVVMRGEGYWLEDLASANGVRVNQARISAPVLLRTGDQIDLGDVGLVFEQSAAPAMPKKQEVGSAELRAGAVAQQPSSAPGCSPLGDLHHELDGCLAELMRRLPLLLMLLLLLVVCVVLFKGLTALAVLGQQIVAGQHGSSSPPASAPSPAPSPSSKPPTNAPPTNPPSQTEGTEKVTILSTRMVFVPTQDGHTVPTLLVKWRNDSQSPITDLTGDVICKFSDGHKFKYPKIHLYGGDPVMPGQTHEDQGHGDGAAIETGEDPAPEVIPTEVKNE